MTRNTITAPKNKTAGVRKSITPSKPVIDRNPAINYPHSNVLPECVKSFSNFYKAVFKAVPDPNLIVDSILIRGNQAIVRYKFDGGPDEAYTGISTSKRSVTINSLGVLRLSNGQLEENLDTVYQVRGQ